MCGRTGGCRRVGEGGGSMGVDGRRVRTCEGEEGGKHAGSLGPDDTHLTDCCYKDNAPLSSRVVLEGRRCGVMQIRGGCDTGWV